MSDYDRALELEVEGVRFNVCSYEDLVAMKSATGRPQDEIDVADLRRARGEIE
jgi:predicted nucleotidyltransferase